MKARRSSRLESFLLLCALIPMAACKPETEHISLKLGHALDQSHPVHKGMVYFVELVEERSQGRIQIEIYPSEQLGSERELLELLQIGAVSIAKVGSTVLETFQPSMAVFGIPFLFPSEAAFWAVLEGDVGIELLNQSAAYGFKGLCYYDSGSRSFYTRNRTINSPEDLRGLSIRTPKSVTSMEMIQALGGGATSIAFGELYGALQQGVVDGAENNPPSYYFSRHFEVCPYLSLDEHTTVPDVLLASRRIWDSLAPEDQDLIERAALDSVPFQRERWRESVEECLRRLEEAGVKISRPDRAPFRRAVEPMLRRYKQNPAYGELIARIERSVNSETEGFAGISDGPSSLKNSPCTSKEMQK
jgi:tripartite ATP-independent transporter DctP family solute receptor